MSEKAMSVEEARMRLAQYVGELEQFCFVHGLEPSREPMIDALILAAKREQREKEVQVVGILRRMLELVDAGKLVRNCNKDHESGWAFEAAKIVVVLAEAQRFIDAAAIRGKKP